MTGLKTKLNNLPLGNKNKRLYASMWIKKRKMISYYCITMRIQVFTYPQTRLFDDKVIVTRTIGEIVNDITKKYKEDTGEDFYQDPILIIDRNQNFHRITMDDPINRYFNGRMGEIYRITDGSSLRYRIVSANVPITKEKGKVKEKVITPEVFASVYENILTMLLERTGKSDDYLDLISRYAMSRDQLQEYYPDSIDGLTIPNLDNNDPQIKDSRGRAMYVFFLKHDRSNVILAKTATAFKEDIVDKMNNVIKHHNYINPDDQVDDITNINDETQVKAFASRFEIIIVYNNPTGKKEYDMGIHPKFYQTYPIQHLTFVVTHHVDQPEFVLLNSRNESDRQEIRNIYAQNGRILESDKTLESYSLRDNIRLMLL